MSKFDLENFKAEKSQPKNKEAQHPKWHKNLSKNGKLIYEEIIKTADIISKNIKSGHMLKVKEREIIASQIASKLGLHRSTIQKRRQPNLVELINKQNLKLAKLWEAEGKKSKNKNKTKVQLSKEITRLKKQLKEERDKNYSEVLTEFLNSELNQKQSSLAAKVSELEAENTVLKNKISKLRVRSIH